MGNPVFQEIIKDLLLIAIPFKNPAYLGMSMLKSDPASRSRKRPRDARMIWNPSRTT
jgi:hypothetical protein